MYRKNRFIFILILAQATGWAGGTLYPGVKGFHQEQGQTGQIEKYDYSKQDQERKQKEMSEKAASQHDGIEDLKAAYDEAAEKTRQNQAKLFGGAGKLLMAPASSGGAQAPAPNGQAPMLERVKNSLSEYYDKLKEVSGFDK